MKIILIAIGKTSTGYLSKGIDEFQKRLKKYIKFELIELPDPQKGKNLTENELLRKESELFLKSIPSDSQVVLLDEKGQEFTSVEFAGFIQKKMNSGIKNLVFLIGGPYGFHSDIVAKANEKSALSKLTFTHEMVRLFFTEQLYRAFTILNNEPYHHE